MNITNTAPLDYAIVMGFQSNLLKKGFVVKLF